MNSKLQEIGTIAGKIWNYLNKKNEFTEVLELKFELQLSNTDLYLALGWLSREDKIDFLIQENSLKVKLK